MILTDSFAMKHSKRFLSPELLGDLMTKHYFVKRQQKSFFQNFKKQTKKKNRCVLQGQELEKTVLYSIQYKNILK